MSKQWPRKQTRQQNKSKYYLNRVLDNKAYYHDIPMLQFSTRMKKGNGLKRYLNELHKH